MDAVYAELKKLARSRLRSESDASTLDATALVHEAYLRIAGQSGVEWQNRAHFFAIAARFMRRILVDHARARRASKRRDTAVRIPLDEAVDAAEERAVDLCRLDDALEALTALDAEQARLVELRFFGGLTNEEAAHVLGRSPATVKRSWTAARAWLRRELDSHG